MDGTEAGPVRGKRPKLSDEPAQQDQEINLKGKVCPYTFIESMLALEEMETDQVLRVVVDYPPAVCDVPRSLKNEGFEILEVLPINDTDWAILVRNKEMG
jgi:tRNA 2-thiouridine synthesizing protein A